MSEFQNLIIIKRLDVFFEVLIAIDIFELGANYLRRLSLVQELTDLLTKTATCPTQVGFQNLPHVHP